MADAKAKSNPNIERIIWRAGELKIKEAAPHLVNLIGTAKELSDYCIAWSLGFCGDETNLSALEKLAAHKADYVRRISREAIAKLADETKRNELKEMRFPNYLNIFKILSKTKTSENLETALREEMTIVKRAKVLMF